MNLKAFQKICSLLLDSKILENLTQEDPRKLVNEVNVDEQSQQSDQVSFKNDSTVNFNFVYHAEFDTICEKINQINLIEKMDILKLNLIKNLYPILVNS